MASAEIEQAFQHHRQAMNKAHDKLLTSIETVHQHRAQKKVEAEDAASVVASRTHYHTNVRFNTINNNLDPQIQVSPNLHELNPEECDVYSSLTKGCPSAIITPVMTHCINSEGEIQGFRFTCGHDEPVSCLPLHRELFFNTVMAECIFDDDNDDLALKLQMHKGKCVDTLVALAQEICKRSKTSKRAGLDCIPDNTDHVVPTNHLLTATSEPLLGSFTCRRVADCKMWVPEPPRFMGLYHAYTRNYCEDFRKHKLFIVVGGGCSALSEEYFNIVVGAGDNMSVQELHESVETWWARKANHRATCKLLLEIADRFSLDVATTIDPYCYEETPTCVPTITTFQSDICMSNNRFSLFNNCVDSTKIDNGLLFHQHPEEGTWIFKGAPKTNSSGSIYGGAFGARTGKEVFPIGMPVVSKLYSWNKERHRASVFASRRMGTIRCRDGDSVVRMNQHGEVIKKKKDPATYTLADESFMNSLQDEYKWQRSYGVTELMPIASVHIQ